MRPVCVPSALVHWMPGTCLNVILRPLLWMQLTDALSRWHLYLAVAFCVTVERRQLTFNLKNGTSTFQKWNEQFFSNAKSTCCFGICRLPADCRAFNESIPNMGRYLIEHNLRHLWSSLCWSIQYTFVFPESSAHYLYNACTGCQFHLPVMQGKWHATRSSYSSRLPYVGTVCAPWGNWRVSMCCWRHGIRTVWWRLLRFYNMPHL